MYIYQIDETIKLNQNLTSFSRGEKNLQPAAVAEYKKTYYFPNRIQYKHQSYLVGQDNQYLKSNSLLNKTHYTKSSLNRYNILFGIGNTVQPLSFPPYYHRYFI